MAEGDNLARSLPRAMGNVQFSRRKKTPTDISLAISQLCQLPHICASSRAVAILS
jgi:hypothetical protein